jgi:hypothetical protein
MISCNVIGCNTKSSVQCNTAVSKTEKMKIKYTMQQILALREHASHLDFVSVDKIDQEIQQDLKKKKKKDPWDTSNEPGLFDNGVFTRVTPQPTQPVTQTTQPISQTSLPTTSQTTITLPTTSQTRLPTTTQTLPTHTQWFYQDPQNNIQGPFSTQEMLIWFHSGFFNDDLKIKRNNDNWTTIARLKTILADRLFVDGTLYPFSHRFC